MKAILCLFLCWMVLASPAASQNVSDEVWSVIENSDAREAFWSIVVRDSTGSIKEGYNKAKLIRPASNLKLLTSAAVLNHLGPEYTYTTKMYGLGYQEGQTWNGDIIINGSGDPSISGDFYEGDRFHVFDKFYQTLDSLGIYKIDGNLIGNTAYFDDQPYPKGWNWDDLSFYYGVEINALSFNNNAVDLEVFADDEVGETPRIQWFPFDTDYVNFINEQVITPSNSEYDEFYRRILGTNTIILRSKLPQGYYEKESLSVLNAPLYFMDTFKKYLEDGQIKVNGRILIENQQPIADLDRYEVLAEHKSEPLRNLLKQVNKESSNFYTEMLLKTAAAEHYKTQGSTELGISMVKEYAHTVGLDTANIEMTDGSGMSPATLIEAIDLTKLLHNIEADSIYKSTLSKPGIDGSLEHRFKEHPLRSNLMGKTGYVSGVRTLSGYLKAESGQQLTFSIATNNYTNKTSYIDYLHEKLIKAIYSKY